MDNQGVGVSLSVIIEELELEVICGEGLSEKMVTVPEVSRPGLAFKGFFDYFGPDRIQIIGMAEHAYLESLTHDARVDCLERYFERSFPCIVIARNLPVPEEMIEIAEKKRVPVFRTKEMTSRFLSSLIGFLNVHLAPRVSMHGVLVEVHGEGILITGESGLGKSETALELVRRGHRLVADDVVDIRRVADKTLIGAAPENIRYMMEIRGIGIIDIKNLFGIGAVKSVEKIDLEINLEMWDENREYERLGVDERYTDILGLEVPLLNMPVAPGRNLAIIIEAAAINNRQKRIGFNTARELTEKIRSSIEYEMNNIK